MILSALGGALLLVFAYGAYRGMKWVATSSKRVSGALNAIVGLTEQNKKLAEIGMMVTTELQMLRSAISQQDPTAETASYQAQQPRTPVGHIPFPNMPPSMYAVPVPDAKEEDLVVSDTDDKEMADQENLENLRLQGYDAE